MRKSKPKKLVASVGRKWLISRGAPRRVTATVVGQQAFVHPARGTRAEMIDASKLFDSEEAAAKSMKLARAWLVEYDDKVIPVQTKRDDSGNTLVFDTKGHLISHGTRPERLHEKRRDAILYFIKRIQETLKNNEYRYKREFNKLKKAQGLLKRTR